MSIFIGLAILASLCGSFVWFLITKQWLYAFFPGFALFIMIRPLLSAKTNRYTQSITGALTILALVGVVAATVYWLSWFIALLVGSFLFLICLSALPYKTQRRIKKPFAVVLLACSIWVVFNKAWLFLIPIAVLMLMLVSKFQPILGTYDDESDELRRVNPATGLPMIGGFDTAGNPYGSSNDI